MEKLVPILLGSDKDQPFADKIIAELEVWGIPYKVHVVSAHKVPELLVDIVKEYNEYAGSLCYVTIAGRSNGLSGTTAGSSIHPVIACPPFSSKEDMMINLNSTLQMPSETPVLTVLDPKNVVLSIVRIFGNSDSDLQEKYRNHIKEIKESFKK
ncbi:AIR carboxylase family protein [Pseudomonadota bacterium]